MKRLAILIVPMVLGFTLVGCGINPGKNADQVDVEGKVTLAGKDVNGVDLNLQVTGTGTLVMPVNKGACKGKVTPGKYTYFLSQASSNAAAFKEVPTKYREGSMERQIEIKGPGPVTFNFE